MISTSAGFKAAQAAAVNKPKIKGSLFFGNYALQQTASSSTPFSADYPAAGAVDGDRTEINIGAATAADNGIGKSSFKSLGIPDNGDTVYLTVMFAAAKYINYLKLYQRAGHGLTEYWVDAMFEGSWQPIAHRVAGGSGYVGPTTMPAGYGDEPYGDTPYGSPWPPYLEGEWSLGLAEIDLGFDVLCTGIRIRPIATEVALDYAEIVELEVFRKVDITSRMISCDIAKKRDFRFDNSLSYTAEVTCDNSDKFFSAGYVPTDAERMAGFTNEDFRSGIPIKIEAGFEVAGAVELIDQFTGYLNDIGGDTNARQYQFSARDYTQFLINRKDYSRAKYNVLLEDCVRYILNRYNVSDYEMSVASTYRRLVVFFSNGEYGLDIIRNLAKATTDGDFYIAEDGTATFKNYATQNEFSINSYDKWAAGTTITNVAIDNPKGVLRRNHIYDNFNSDALDATLWETVQSAGENQSEMLDIGTPPASEYLYHLLAVSRKLANNAPQTTTKKEINGIMPLSSNDPVNVWFDLWINNLANSINRSEDGIYVEIGLNTGVVQSAVTAYGAAPVMNREGYYLIFQQGQAGLSFEGDSTMRIIRVAANGTRTVIGYLQNYGIPTNKTRFLLQKNGSTWKVYANSVNILTATETGTQITGLKYFQFVNWAMTDYTLVGDASSISADIYFQNLMYGYTVESTGTYISQVIDRGPNFANAGNATSEFYETGSGTADFYIRVSDDGITWGEWIAIAPPADLSTIASKRYNQIKVEMGGSLFTDVELPVISEIALSWAENNSRYSPVADFDLRGQMLSSNLKRTNTLAGDNIIYNSFKVSSKMPALVGNDTDILYQFFDFSGFISSIKPKYISVDTDMAATINDGMDTAAMAGANPASLVAIYKSGSLSTSFIYPSPTKPKIRITVTAPAVITALYIQGKKWDRSEKFVYEYSDITSQQDYDVREFTYTSEYIQSYTHSQQIAQKAIALFKEQKTFYEELPVRPLFSAQINDRVALYDAHEGIDDDFYIVAINHHFSVADKEADVTTTITPVKIV